MITELLLNKAFREHHRYPNGEEISVENLTEIPAPIYFQKDEDCPCVWFKQDRSLHTSYYIGVDWISKSKAIYVEPKLNDSEILTNYLAMLFSALKHPEVSKYTDDLFEIKLDAPQIEITQQQDLLTPLLVVQFLKVVKEIVRKGLKKSYYKVENNLYAKVKGKVLVSQTIKKNLLKNKPLNTYCSYDEFGLNGLENRLLKKALVFVQRYLPTIKNIHSEKYSEEIFNYINPAFEFVSEEAELNDVKHTKTNVFYKEYEDGLRLAKLILKRFGYNINNTEQKTIKTPPFWIDMSKLFELYVYGKLLQSGYKVEYQFNANYGQPDFLLLDEKVVADAKYKVYYKNDLKGNSKRDEIAKDIRQLSGYARDRLVLNELGYKDTAEDKLPIIPCLIIYPDQGSEENLWENQESPIEGFVKFRKKPLKLPEL